jgi:predicted ATP-grasp superfamily ATP-dependent carboligase
MPGCKLVVAETMTDEENHNSAFTAALDWCDFCLLIAPELDDCLGRLVRRVEQSGRRLLGPGSVGVGLTASKAKIAELWARAGVPTPEAYSWTDWFGENEIYPAVCKPSDGAGSTATYYLTCRDDVFTHLESLYAEGFHADDLLFQPYIPGRPASVSFLIGAAGAVPLLPVVQKLSRDGRFRYLGGEVPILPRFADRAIRLSRQAVECVPGLFGYVGVDLILGKAEDGSQDYAIEINPRLTTSYVGLRQLTDTNIAGAMLSMAEGQTLPGIVWKPGRVRFNPDGSAEYDPTPGAVFI